MSDLSIDAYHQPAVAADGGKGQFTAIKARSSLIGYGSGGGLLRTFFLREGQDVDVGYSKLFITTKYVDYSSVLQRSPFEVGDDRAAGTKDMNPNFWDTMLIRVVQRRAGTTRKLELSSNSEAKVDQ